MGSSKEICTELWQKLNGKFKRNLYRIRAKIKWEVQKKSVQN